MSSFDEREKSFEKKFAHDEEIKFKVNAKRNKYLGQWASQILGYDQEKEKEYIQSVIKADFEEAGDEDVFRKLKEDLKDHNMPDEEIRKKWMNLLKKQNQNLFKFLILIFFILSNSAYSEIKFISAHTNQVRVVDGDSLQIRKEKIRLSFSKKYPPLDLLKKMRKHIIYKKDFLYINKITKKKSRV